MKKQWSTVFSILLALVVVIFTILNVDPVAINFGFTVVEIPLAAVLIGTLLIGVLIAVLLSTGIILKYKNEQKKLKKELQESDSKKETEKQELVRQHEIEIQSLVEENEKDKKEIRDLNRRIQNISKSHEAQTK